MINIISALQPNITWNYNSKSNSSFDNDSNGWSKVNRRKKRKSKNRKNSLSSNSFSLSSNLSLSLISTDEEKPGHISSQEKVNTTRVQQSTSSQTKQEKVKCEIPVSAPLRLDRSQKCTADPIEDLSQANLGKESEACQRVQTSNEIHHQTSLGQHNLSGKGCSKFETLQK